MQVLCDLRPTFLKCNCQTPGYSKTSTIPLGRSGKLSEVADLCVYLASKRSSYVHGVTVNVAGGKTRG